MPDSFTVVSERGLGSRLGRSIRGVLIGLALFGLAFPLLFWNEGRAVKRHRDLQEGAGAVATVSANEVDPAHEGTLVHMTGTAETEAVLRDAAFGVAVNAIHLRRRSEMYQWVEHEESRTEKQLGGSEKTITTYTYTREWSEDVHDSGSFHEPAGHENPVFSHPSQAWTADEVRLGAFELHPAMVDSIDGFETVGPPAPAGETGWRLAGDTLYLPAAGSAAGGEPQVGDQRIRFEAAPATEVSIVALQRGDGFGAWTGSEGSSVLDLSMGVLSAEQMFAALESQNRALTWILRGVGFAMMVIGLSMLFAPLAVAADVVPFIGDLLRFGTLLFATTVSLALSLITIAVGWVAYRPLVGVPLLVMAIAALAGLLWAGRSRRSRERTPDGHAAGAPA